MLLVEDVMTRDTISVSEDVSIDVAIDLMVEKNISGLPVIDSTYCLQGIITEYDVLKLFGTTHSDALNFKTCADFMVRKVRTIQQTAHLEAAVKIFQVASLRRLLVLDGEKFVGVLSRRDIVRSIRDGRLSLANV